GQEERVVVEFATFPELRFVGVTCNTNAGREILIRAGNETAAGAAACNPLGGIGLSFSAPVVNSQVRDHVRFAPDLAVGRETFHPAAHPPDYPQPYQPHRSGGGSTVWLPVRLAAAESYRIVAAARPDTAPGAAPDAARADAPGGASVATADAAADA